MKKIERTKKPLNFEWVLGIFHSESGCTNIFLFAHFVASTLSPYYWLYVIVCTFKQTRDKEICTGKHTYTTHSQNIQ